MNREDIIKGLNDMEDVLHFLSDSEELFDIKLLYDLLSSYNFIRFWEFEDESDLLRIDFEFVNFEQLEKSKDELEEFFEQLKSMVVVEEFKFESIDSGDVVEVLFDEIEDVDGLLQMIKKKGYVPSFSIEFRVR